MNDILATVIGVALGVLVSIPTALLIASLTTPRADRQVRNLGATWQQREITINPPSREIVVFDAEFREVL